MLFIKPRLSINQRNNYIGIGLALLAVIIWSGNFIAAKGVVKLIPPVSLAFYRWLTASIVLLPFAFRKTKQEWVVIKRSFNYLFWAALSGVALFNTFVYIGAHYTTAINLALIGTTSSPIMAIILARIFLKERLDILKIIGVSICILGVLYLLSKGDFRNLIGFHFTKGDGWILFGALAFAVYNTLVKKKPTGISPISFLFVVFSLGTLMLFPFYIWEITHNPAVEWERRLLLVILFLGIGASVISFLCWNMAIGRLGAGHTALFGNLIPVFSSIEAAVLLKEDFTSVHIISMVIIFSGILIANWWLLVKKKN